MEYFIIENGSQTGPYTIDQLYQKHITSETLVWTKGMSAWTPAWQVGELKYILNAGNAAEAVPPPFPGDEAGPVGQGAGSTEPETGQPTAQAQAQKVPEATPAGATPAGPPRRKDHSRTALVAVLVVLALICLFSFTCPDKDDHEEALKALVVEQLDRKKESSENDIFTMGIDLLKQVVLGPVFDAELDHMLSVHKYIVFSKGTFNVNGRDYTVSIGLLGKVFPVNNKEFIHAMREVSSGTIVPDGSSPDTDDSTDPAGGTDGESPSQEDGQDSSAQGETAMEGARSLRDKVTSTVADEVKKQVAQQSDSTTSSVVGALVDGLANWIKGL